ncbi:MAG: YkvA family protein [Cyanobacteria bacterium J06638_20]
MKSPLQGLYDWYRATIRNPKYRWWIVLGTLAYLVLPFDIAPDFLPIVGQLDDALLVTLLFAEVSQVVIERVKSKKTADEDTFAASVKDETDSVDVNAVVIE